MATAARHGLTGAAGMLLGWASQLGTGTDQTPTPIVLSPPGPATQAPAPVDPSPQPQDQVWADFAAGLERATEDLRAASAALEP